MNDEQKRKEDLEAAKGWLAIANKDNNTMAIQILENLFPELKEPEDEDKIMKELIYNIIVSTDYTPSSKEIFSVYGKTKEDALAWLEKQKPIELDKDAEIRFRSILNLIDNGCPIEKSYIDFIKSVYTMLMEAQQQKNFDEKDLFEKQGEQKNVEQDTEINDLWVYIREWNDKFGRLPKDEDELAACIDYVMKRQKPADDYCQKNCKGYRDTGGRCFADGECEAKKKAEQKPTWSEEDERHRKRIVERLEDIRKSKEDNIDVASVILSEINWLKSLKERVQLQPKQEWNEANDSMIEGIKIAILDYYDKENADEIISWLESLKERVQPQPKYHWKPSEEQMEALNAINNIGELSYVEQSDLLVKLYNDLKKL